MSLPRWVMDPVRCLEVLSDSASRAQVSSPCVFLGVAAVQLEFAASHFQSPFGSPARKQEDMQLLAHLLQCLQPHVAAAHFAHHSAGSKDSVVELVFREDSASQAAMFSLVDAGVWDYQFPGGACGSLPLSAISKRLRSNLATVTVYRLPVEFMRQGAVATLLQAAGYTSVSVRAEHMGGLRLGKSGLHPCVGRGDVLVAYVEPPADDPHLSRLPRAFQDRDRQVDISVRCYDPRTNTSGAALHAIPSPVGLAASVVGPPPPPPPGCPSTGQVQPSLPRRSPPDLHPQPPVSALQPFSSAPQPSSSWRQPAVVAPPRPGRHQQAGGVAAPSLPPGARRRASSPSPPPPHAPSPSGRQPSSTLAGEAMDTSPPAPPDCPLREAASLWLEDNLEALPRSHYEGVIGAVADSHAAAWAVHEGSATCPPVLQRALRSSAASAMGRAATPTRRSARLASQPAVPPPPYWSPTASSTLAAPRGRGQPWP